MKIIIKQKVVSLLGEFTAEDENKNELYVIKGKPGLSKTFEIYDQNGKSAGKIKEKIISLVPHYLLYDKNEQVGDIVKNITLFKDRYTIGFKDWVAEGDLVDFNYEVKRKREKVFSIKRRAVRIINPVYTLEVENRADAFYAVMVAVAIFIMNADEKNKNNN